MPSILLTVPAYGGIVSDGTLKGLYDCAKKFDRIGIRNELITVANSSLITTLRSDLTSVFMNCTNHTHQMWIDSDIGFCADDVLKLLELETDIAVGAYSMKIVPPKYCFTLKAGGEKRGNAVEITSSGFGFNLISREAITKMNQKFPELRYVPSSNSREITEREAKNSFHLFHQIIDEKSGAIVSEDKSFFRRAAQADIISWLRTDINLTHVGSHVFTGADLTKVI